MEEMLTLEFYENYFYEQLSKTRSQRVYDKKIYFRIKRFFDILLCLLGVTIAIPLVILFGILVYIESPGSVIFKQQRVGKNGKIFTLYKLRSMRLDAEKNGPKWAEKNDERVLKVGRFIRKTRIDEIPQIINILKGDMTIIGPRPEIPKFTYEFDKKYPGFTERLTLTPGLTGLAQVSGGYDLSPKEKLQKDLEYIEKQNIILDITIILKTIFIMFSGDGAR